MSSFFRRSPLFLLALIPLLGLTQDPHYSPLQLVNNSGKADENVYFIAHAMTPAGDDCFLQFDEQGMGTCIPVTRHTVPSTYSYRFAQFKNKILQIPELTSGRLYVSLGYPMVLWTTEAEPGKIKINSLSGFRLGDPNYYTLYDKVEFSYAPNGFFINPTAVDFFTLPLRITNEAATGDLKASGLSRAHQDIFAGIHAEVKKYDKTLSQAWQKLFVNFDNDSNKPLRFMSPGKAMVIDNPASFDIHYLDNQSAYEFDYLDFVWNYYQTHTLQIDAKELCKTACDSEDYLFTGQVDKTGHHFVFTSPLETVVIEKPENSIPFFAGDGGTLLHDNDTAKAVIVKNLTGAFSVGLLPIASGTLNHDYFKAYDKNKYYLDNEIITTLASPEQGPWFDLYGKALHSFNEPIYTFAYDDLLAQDGTMHVDRGIAEPTQIIVGVVDMDAPNPYTHQEYARVDLVPANTSSVQIYYEGNLLPIDRSTVIENVTTPILVEINGYPVEIYIEYPIAVIDPAYPYKVTAGDISITKTSPTTAHIAFPGEWK